MNETRNTGELAQRKGQTTTWSDEKHLRLLARQLSREFRVRIVAESNQMLVPSIKYKWQALLESVIADMQTFV